MIDRDILSEKPEDALAAVQWAKEEKESQKVLMEHMRPFIMEIAMKRGRIPKTAE